MSGVVSLELIGGEHDGVTLACPAAMIEGGNILWVGINVPVDGATVVSLEGELFDGLMPYWCETDPIDDEHRASYYPEALKERDQ